MIAESIKKHLNEDAFDIAKNLTYPPGDFAYVVGQVCHKKSEIITKINNLRGSVNFLSRISCNPRFNDSIRDLLEKTCSSLYKILDVLNKPSFMDALLNQEVQGRNEWSKTTSDSDYYIDSNNYYKQLTQLPDRDTIHNGYGYNPFSRKTEKMNIQQARNIIKRFFQEELNSGEYDSPTDGRYSKLNDALSHPFEFLNIVKNDDNYSEPDSEGGYRDWNDGGYYY